MKSLIKYQLRNVFHNKIIYVCIGINTVLGILTMFLTHALEATEGSGTTSTLFERIAGILSSEPDIITMLFIVLFVCFEFHEGVMKNNIGRGYTRIQVLISKYIGALVGVLCIEAVSVVLTVFDFSSKGIGYTPDLMNVIIVSIIGIIAATVFYATLAFLVEKNSIAIITLLLLPRVLGLVFTIINSQFKLPIGDYWITNILPKYASNPAATNMFIPIGVFLAYAAVSVVVGVVLTDRKEIK